MASISIIGESKKRHPLSDVESNVSVKYDEKFEEIDWYVDGKAVNSYYADNYLDALYSEHINVWCGTEWGEMFIYICKSDTKESIVNCFREFGIEVIE